MFPNFNFQDFMTVPIMSQSVFDDMDKNKDGFVSLFLSLSFSFCPLSVSLSLCVSLSLLLFSNCYKPFLNIFQDFMTVPIMSQSVFDDMDKNKDGFVSKGELRLAQRGISMKDLADILQELDNDGDGKLTFDEIKTVIK